MALGLMSVVVLVWADIEDGKGGVSSGGKYYSPLLARFLRGEKRSTNSAFRKCFGDISVTQNCPE